MHINATNTYPISLDGADLESVDDFTYLGSLISNDNGAKKDIKARLNKARGAFCKLQAIWKSKQYRLKTKIKIYNSNVKSVLLYGSECWRVTKKDMSQIEAFHTKSLRRICNIIWPNHISNYNLFQITGCRSIVTELSNADLGGWVTFLGCTMIKYQRLP